jgi:hypothetical protein
LFFLSLPFSFFLNPLSFLSFLVISSSLFTFLLFFFGCFFFLSLSFLDCNFFVSLLYLFCLFLVFLSPSLILVVFSRYSFFLSLFISCCLPLVILSSSLSLYSILLVILWVSSLYLCKLRSLSSLCHLLFPNLKHFSFLHKFVSASSSQSLLIISTFVFPIILFIFFGVRCS